MSRENVEVVMESIRLFGAGNLSALAELQEADSVVYPPEGWPEPGPFVGKKAVMANWAQIQEDWSEQEMTVKSVAAEGDVVVARMLWNVLGRRSRIRSRLDVSGAYRVRAGKIIEARFFFDWAEALEAVGLRE